MVLEIYRHEKEGKPIKRLWFNAQAKQIMCGIICGYICRACWNLQNVCQIVCRILSKKWKIVRKKTHTSQKTPEQSRKSISEFHAKTWIEKVCRIYLKGLPIWNKHGCHLFLMIKKTHGKKVAEEVWVASAQSSLEKNDNVRFTWQWFLMVKNLPGLSSFKGKVTNQCSGKKRMGSTR